LIKNAMTIVTRQAIAAHLTEAFAVTWASKTKLLWTASNSSAPKPLVDALLSLPEGFYRDLDEVWNHLSGDSSPVQGRGRTSGRRPGM
jgi:hypothetical protein